MKTLTKKQKADFQKMLRGMARVNREFVRLREELMSFRIEKTASSKVNIIVTDAKKYRKWLKSQKGKQP